MQKKFIFFLLKNKNNEKIFNQFYFLRKFFLSYINQKLYIKKKFVKVYKKKFLKTPCKKKNNNMLYDKLVGMLTKKGDKEKAKTLLNKALLETSKECKYTPNLILEKIINKLKTSVEAKKIRIRRSLHFVPFPLKKERKLFIISKWLLLGAKHQNTKTTFAKKLNLEFTQLIKNKKSFSYKFKKQNISKALQNKSNNHFRW